MKIWIAEKVTIEMSGREARILHKLLGNLSLNNIRGLGLTMNEEDELGSIFQSLNKIYSLSK